MADKLIGEFILAKRLGGGAEGEVYEAVSSTTHRKVAIKIIRRTQEHPEFLERLKKLKGSVIASCPALLDVFEHDGKIVTVHEFLDGVPLRAAIQPGAGSKQKRRELADALISAVRVLHVAGHLHGDLSPDNVFVSDDATIKLIDPRISTKQSGGGVLGTPNYAAPEMLQFGSAPTSSADVFRSPPCSTRYSRANLRSAASRRRSTSSRLARKPCRPGGLRTRPRTLDR
ncbi:MAG: protein kinase [Elusimicrobiota bacterium]|nr:MAG: protein kinase [Elusimicrobiota bacterium]